MLNCALSVVEQALIGALSKRYPSSPSEEDFGPWHDAYADTMRAVYAAHGEDLDVCALFTEAIMNRTPWQLWNLVTGEPAENAGREQTSTMNVLPGAFGSMLTAK